MPALQARISIEYLMRTIHRRRKALPNVPTASVENLHDYRQSAKMIEPFTTNLGPGTCSELLQTAGVCALRLRSLPRGLGGVAGSESCRRILYGRDRAAAESPLLEMSRSLSRQGRIFASPRAEILAKGDTGQAIVVPGHPEQSLLITAIRYTDEQLQMPPDGKLSEDEIARLTRWVESGAPWPTTKSPPLEAGPTKPAARSITDAQRAHWSFQPIRDVSPPKVHDEAWPRAPLDHFILAELESQGLARNESADKRTLIRRATYDLTGLPPTPDEVAAFVADTSSNAFATVVERLLASPHYGERWGRHWLDVVRYADARDLIQLPAESDFREAWRYRDWVVRAFNEDLPFDAFITRQLAGDLLQPTDPARIDADALVATGMLAIADFVPGDDVDKEQMIADYVNDEIDVVEAGCLGTDAGLRPVPRSQIRSDLGGRLLRPRRYLLQYSADSRSDQGKYSFGTRYLLCRPAEVQTVERQAIRDKQRLAVLPEEIRLAAGRAFRTALDRKVLNETARYLVAASQYRQTPTGDERPSLAEFAAIHELEQSTLAQWTKYLDGDPHPRVVPCLNATEASTVEPLAAEVQRGLSTVPPCRAARHAGLTDPTKKCLADPTKKCLADSALVCFRADDPRMARNEAVQIVRWPDHAGLAEDAIPVVDVPGPCLTTAAIRRSVAQCDPVQGSRNACRVWRRTAAREPVCRLPSGAVRASIAAIDRLGGFVGRSTWAGADCRCVRFHSGGCAAQRREW